MIDADRKPFAEAMTQLFAIYGDKLTKPLLNAWWGLLERYPLERVKLAMNAHASDIEAGMFRPTPAHILKHLERTIPDAEAAALAAKVKAYRDRFNELDAERLQLLAAASLGLPGDPARLKALSTEMTAMMRDPEWRAAERALPPALRGFYFTHEDRGVPGLSHGN